MLTYLLIVSLFGGIGYQARRWLGKQRWYMGIAFVALGYVPGFAVVLFALLAMGHPFDAARGAAAGPVFGGLIIGAVCLCSSGGWWGVPVPEERTEEHGGASEK